MGVGRRPVSGIRKVPLAWRGTDSRQACPPVQGTFSDNHQTRAERRGNRGYRTLSHMLLRRTVLAMCGRPGPCLACRGLLMPRNIKRLRSGMIGLLTVASSLFLVLGSATAVRAAETLTQIS